MNTPKDGSNPNEEGSPPGGIDFRGLYHLLAEENSGLEEEIRGLKADLFGSSQENKRLKRENRELRNVQESNYKLIQKFNALLGRISGIYTPTDYLQEFHAEIQRIFGIKVHFFFGSSKVSENLLLNGGEGNRKDFFYFSRNSLEIPGGTNLSISTPNLVSEKYFQYLKKISGGSSSFTSTILKKEEIQKLFGGIDSIGSSGVLIQLGDIGYATFTAQDEDHYTGSDTLYLVDMMQRVTENLNLKCQIEHHSIDTGTGFHTRKSYSKMAGNLYKKMFQRKEESREGTGDDHFCIAMIDLDNLKNLNSQQGHSSADEVIKTVARIIMQNTRNDDVRIRFGGDEFVLLLATNIENAKKIIENIFQELNKVGFLNEKGELNYPLTIVDPETPGAFTQTISVGLAPIFLDRLSPSEVINRLNEGERNADSALYAAKAAGKAQLAVKNT